MAAALSGAAPTAEAVRVKTVALLFAIFTIVGKKRKKSCRIGAGDGFYRPKRQILDAIH